MVLVTMMDLPVTGDSTKDGSRGDLQVNVA